jgi:hypothetical protein
MSASTEAQVIPQKEGRREPYVQIYQTAYNAHCMWSRSLTLTRHHHATHAAVKLAELVHNETGLVNQLANVSIPITVAKTAAMNAGD